MKKDIRIISKDDCAKLAELYHTAQTTPVIALTGAAILSGNDWASQAWRRVSDFQEELGKKYKFDHTIHAINVKTGQVMIA